MNLVSNSLLVMISLCGSFLTSRNKVCAGVQNECTKKEKEIAQKHREMVKKPSNSSKSGAKRTGGRYCFRSQVLDVES
jgi:hypothetical protein